MVDSSRSILKRCGLVLIVAGVIDIGLMVWCITHRVNYSSCLNIFALIAGILLVRVSLKTARVVALFAASLISCFAVLIATAPFLIPFDFLKTYIGLAPEKALLFPILAGSILSLLVWTYRQLTSPPVQAAIHEAGLYTASGLRKRLRPSTGFWIGGILSASFLLVISFATHGATAEKARHKAAAISGPGYRYFVTSLNMTSGGGGKRVQANVTAYNDKEIKQIEVKWSVHEGRGGTGGKAEPNDAAGMK